MHTANEREFGCKWLHKQQSNDEPEPAPQGGCKPQTSKDGTLLLYQTWGEKWWLAGEGQEGRMWVCEIHTESLDWKRSLRSLSPTQIWIKSNSIQPDPAQNLKCFPCSRRWVGRVSRTSSCGRYLLCPATATTQIHWLFQNQGIPPLCRTQFPWTSFLSFGLDSTVGYFFLLQWIPAREELFPNNRIVSK